MMKIRNPAQLTSKAILASLAFLALAGCETPNKTIVPTSEKPYELKHDTKTLILNFQKYGNKLPADEQARLVAALKPFGPGKTSIHVTLPGKGSRFGKQRLKHIIRTALQAGIKAKQIHRSDNLPPANGHSIEVILDTYRAIPPLCPNWSSTFGTGYGRGPTSNFGCSTATNFLLMIDDPIVLFKGETASSRDAARDSLAIADHRVGKDKGKWLKVEKSEGGASGSSGSAGSGGSGGSGGSQ